MIGAGAAGTSLSLVTGCMRQPSRVSTCYYARNATETLRGGDDMSAHPSEIEFRENRVKMLREQVTRWYNAHRDATDDLFEAQRQLRIARGR